MKCKTCNLCWAAEGEQFPTCKADPNWPAPCEYEDEYEDEEEKPSCSTCDNADQDTTDKVACCNCCEDYSFYTPIKDRYTLDDLGRNWW